MTQDTTADTEPYRLQIFFQQPDGQYKLVVSTDSAIDAEFPNGKDGYRSGDNFYDVSIVDGIVIISVQLLRGHYEHKFRYQKENFELIGFSETASEGIGAMHIVDFNLSTGVLIEKDESYETDKVIRSSKRKVMIRPLPKLQNFRPFQNESF